MKRLIDSLGGARGIGIFAAMVIAALLGIALLGANDTNAGKSAPETMEQRLSEILESIEGVEGVHVMISEDETGAPCGAVIVADGLNGVKAWLDVQSAVQAALGIELDRIRVLGGSGSEGGF